MPPNGPRTVRAIDATTGAERWVVEGVSVALTAAGEVLVQRTVTDLEGVHFSLAAITPTGAQHWTQPAAAGLVGARELADGTIAYSTSDGLLHRVRPVPEPPVTKASVGPSHASFSAACNEKECLGDRCLGTIIRVQRPKAGASGPSCCPRRERSRRLSHGPAGHGCWERGRARFGSSVSTRSPCRQAGTVFGSTQTKRRPL